MNGWLELTLGAAFFAGLSGGVHCAAMCGPLVAIACGTRSEARLSRDRTPGPASGNGPTPSPFLARTLACNAGRIASYCAAGLAAGALGAAGLGTRGDPAVQNALLALMSGTLVLMAAYIGGMRSLARTLEAAGSVVWRRVEPCTRYFLPADTAARAFGLGLIWGWLPCGMVYLALVAAIASADPLHGAALMAAFGLGTLPNLVAMAASFRHLVAAARGRSARSVAAAAMAAAGFAGIAAALRPDLASAAGSWCMRLSGVASLLGGGF
ncbi:MAG: sulfite exporter TauE/SafE family protein [Burkholderiales bacterium]|nr:sulfite exporter TauE/SafE family protein [Burkholderiales bacterium]